MHVKQSKNIFKYSGSPSYCASKTHPGFEFQYNFTRENKISVKKILKILHLGGTVENLKYFFYGNLIFPSTMVEK